VADRRHDGQAVLGEQLGIAPEDVPAHMTGQFGTRFAEAAIEAAGGAWAEDSPLSRVERSLLVLGALVSLGGVEPRLRAHVRLAVRNGIAPDRIEAAVAFLAPYAGYPRASVAIEIVRDELSRANLR
jgi:4-carboxymuconolactone decarboxylase